MTDPTGPVPPLTGQDRRRIATRPLADATGIGRAPARRPATALTGHRRDRVVGSAI
jgi:hypothetical protein